MTGAGKNLMKKLILILLIFGTNMYVYADDAHIDWKALNEEVATLYRQGHVDRAVEAAKQSLYIAEKSFGPNHADVATSLNNLAWLYRVQGRYAEAEAL